MTDVSVRAVRCWPLSAAAKSEQFGYRSSGFLAIALAMTSLRPVNSGSPLANERWWHVQVLGDDDRWIGVLKRRRTGQQMKSGAPESILVGSAVDVETL